MTAALAVLVASLSSVASPAAAAPQPGTITTIAGGTGGGPALNLALHPGELAVRGGIVYVADDRLDAVQAIDLLSGELQTVAGIGDPIVQAHQTPRADGGPATASRIATPAGVGLDSDGRVYVSDSTDNRIRRVDGSGIINTFAGGGNPADGRGDGLPATDAKIESPSSLVFDPSGNLFVVTGHAFVRKIAKSGIITTVAGIGNGSTCGCARSAANRPALEAEIHPRSLAVDAAGRLHIGTEFQVLRLDEGGILRLVAGTPALSADLGDGGPATEAALGLSEALGFDAAGNLFIADTDHDRVRKVDLAGLITTVAGGGNPSDGLGDGGAATSARLSNPSGVVVGPTGELYVADTDNHRLRKVVDGVISTVAGNGTWTLGGDGGPAKKAQLSSPEGMARDGAGNIYVADNQRVRMIDPSGRITTVAGSGWGFAGDGGPAISARLHDPHAVAVDRAGNLFIADTSNDRIRKVDTAGIITTVAGGGTAALGDGGPATGAYIQRPRAIAVDGAGNLYVDDGQNHRVRKVTAAGTISTFAGGGTPAGGTGEGDGGPATSAGLNLRGSVHLLFDPHGRLLISDGRGARVRMVDLAGVITTVAGTGSSNGFSTDGDFSGKLATELNLVTTGALAFDAAGALYLAGGQTPRIMRVDDDGRALIVAGTGLWYNGLGEGGPATAARIEHGGHGLAFDQLGNLYVNDGSANRIRRIEGAAVPLPQTGNGLFRPLDPARILDTRNGTGGFSSPVGPGASIAVGVTGVGGVPASGVSAVVLNVTVTSPSTGGFLTVYPAGSTRPMTSSINFGAGQTLANMAVAKVGATGKVSIYNNAGVTSVILDVVGWYGTPS